MENQQQPINWETSGYNPFMERSPRTFNANELLNNLISPFIESIVDNAIIYDPFTDTQSQNLNGASQPISADQISGGMLTSNNENLTIDMNSGQINFNDGVQNLLNIGGTNSQGTDNSLTINNAQGQTILSS